MTQRTLNFVILFSLWLLAAAAVGGYGLLRLVPRPTLQFVLALLTLLLLLSYRFWPDFRIFVGGLPLRLLILIHATRFIGCYFLILHAKGQLPYAFAVPGGWGDIAIAASALGLCCLPLQTATGRKMALWWNAIGLADILLVVGAAAVLGAQDAMSMLALTVPPLCLLPTFLVPIIIASHVVIFERLLSARPQKAAHAPASST